MPRAIQQDVPLQPFSQSSWAGGMNSAVPAEHIADNEAQLVLNMEFDKDDQLVSRSGTKQFHFSQPSLTYASRITSLHYYENDNGDVAVIYTSGNKVYTSPNDGSNATDRTGALTLPNDTFWQWVNYAGLAIGVNKSTASDNPIKWNGVGNAALLGGTPPKGNYIEVWNDRVWIAKDSVLYGSKLGDPENWTDATLDTGAVTLDVSKNDGDKITGLIAFRNSLFIFKRNAIYVLSATSSPATASSRFRVDPYSKNVGCVAPYSIKPVLDDVLFLSNTGICSLTAAAVVGDLRTALLSRNIKELSTFLRTTMDISAIVLSEVNQYWLFLPDYANPSGASEVYVMDYQNIQQGVVRWVKFDGKVAASCATVNYVNGAVSYVLGVKDTAGQFRLYKYVPKDINTLTDSLGNANVPISKKVITKSFNLGAPLLLKYFHQVGLAYSSMTADLALTLQYYFDDYPPSGGFYSFVTNTTIVGAIWGLALWGVGVWGNFTVKDFFVWRRFLEAKGERKRKGNEITFLITNAQANQGFILKELAFEFAVLTTKQVKNV